MNKKAAISIMRMLIAAFIIEQGGNLKFLIMPLMIRSHISYYR